MWRMKTKYRDARIDFAVYTVRDGREKFSTWTDFFQRLDNTAHQHDELTG